jgi:hypothetical protein
MRLLLFCLAPPLIFSMLFFLIQSKNVAENFEFLQIKCDKGNIIMMKTYNTTLLTKCNIFYSITFEIRTQNQF